MKTIFPLLAVIVLAASAHAQPASAPASGKQRATIDCKPRHDHRAEKQQINPGKADCPPATKATSGAASGVPPHDHRKEK